MTALSLPHPPAEAPCSTSEATLRVLIVDDELIIRDAAAAMLRAGGYVVDCAENGKRGLELFNAAGGAYDVIILDLIMPVLNGYETFEQIKQLGAAPRVLIASGYSLDNQGAPMLEDGAAGFLPKPFRRDTLIAAVAAVHSRV